MNQQDADQAGGHPSLPTSPSIPLSDLPHLHRRETQFASLIARAGQSLKPVCLELAEMLGEAPEIMGTEVLWRAAGLRRPGVVAHLSWPRLATRLGLSLENPLAHAVVDRLLASDRTEAELRLPVTPVEWGVLTYALTRSLARLGEGGPGPLGPWDLLIDRVGPEPFPPDGLGSIATIVWSLRIGTSTGTLRLWLPERLVALWLLEEHRPGQVTRADLSGRFSRLSTICRAFRGTITLARGLGRLRPAMVLPLDPTASGLQPRAGDPFTLAVEGAGKRLSVAAELVSGLSSARLRVLAPPRCVAIPLEARPMPPAPSTPPADRPEPTEISPAELPVTLVVELGRVNLPLARLADLRAGDVLELSRHAREPVELTSGGKLVARGELVQIDTELGVRILSVYL